MTLRWNWGTGMFVVYGVFAVATSAVVAFSMRERVDLVSDDYYDQAVRLDARRQAEARAAALGPAFSITADAASQRVLIAWPAGAPIESGTVTLYRPSDASKDRVSPIAPDRDGRQQISLAGLAMGRWMVQVSWQSGGQAYYAEREITVESSR
jgi:hypothetical protein